MKISNLQKRLFAWGMSKANDAEASKIKISDYPDYQSLGELKQALLGNLSGKILEIGPGAGANCSYYPKHINWIGVEPNPFMHQYLQQEAYNYGLSSVNIYQGQAESLPFDDNSMDCVISTHVLCSVKDIEASLNEVKRILKPGGTFIFIEHIAAKSGSLNRTIQNIISPLWQKLFDNCHPNRETWKAIEATGFDLVEYHHFRLSFPVVSPHIAGVAQKSNES